jgi:hypothetical protein
MRKLCLFVFVLLGLGAACGQSEPPEPAAHDNYSGMYTFLKEGEFVQVNLDAQGKVTGFISRYGDQESDRGAFLDHFFKQASLQGKAIQFTTQQVHGVWFEFKGNVGRGAGKTANDEDYYELKGTLTEYTTDANQKASARSREVIFKSFPQDVAGR